MTLHRFYISPDRWDPENLTLDETETRHASEVLRLREGEKVSVFDGRGHEIHALIAELSKRSCRLQAESHHHAPPPAAPLLLAQAIPKGKNMDLVLQKATELGATGIFPLLTERTVVRLDAAEAADKQEKWQRIVIEACKQCGQNLLPTVHAPQTLAQFLTNLPEAGLRLIAALTPEARPLHRLLETLPADAEANASTQADAEAATAEKSTPGAVILIGPEGDFTPAELSAAALMDFLPLSLGSIILRTETAAMAALTITGYELSRNR
ncbi:MAG: ribosomal rna small subunit methyltransferase e [Verrucomicrobiales bacterium]|nr:ribosomal rna small subunit methyltransferase e [Verrucomicrobiales bacterium]